MVVSIPDIQAGWLLHAATAAAAAAAAGKQIPSLCMSLKAAVPLFTAI